MWKLTTSLLVLGLLFLITAACCRNSILQSSISITLQHTHTNTLHTLSHTRMSLLSCFICMLHSLEHHIAMAGGLITIFIFDLISARPWPTGDGYMYVHMYAHTYICRCAHVYDLHVRFFILPWRTLYVPASLYVFLLVYRICV